MDTFAFADTASPRVPYVNPSERKGASSANCFRVDWYGKVEEGILLDFDHPSAPNKTALIFGESNRYMGANTNPDRMPKFEVAGSRYLMRKARTEEIAIHGKQPFYIFNRFDASALNYVLVHVDFGMPNTMTPKNPLWAGIDGDYEEVSWGGHESVVRLNAKHGTLKIFFADSSVGIITYADFGTSAKLKYLKNKEEVLAARLNVVEALLAETDDIGNENQKVNLADKWFVELANMLRCVGYSEQLRRTIMGSIETFAERYAFSEYAKAEIAKTLRELGDTTIYGWLVGNYTVDLATSPSAAAPTVSPKRFDAELHSLISEAISYPSDLAWDNIRKRLVKAAADGQLRPGVKHRFIVQCPPGFAYMASEVGQLAAFGEEGGNTRTTSPLRSGRDKEKLPKHVLLAQQRQKQLDRASRQPRRGATGQKQNNYGPGKHQKKGGNK